MRTPTVHLNGTGKSGLLRQYIDAMNALKDAMGAMNQAAPNARDYYPQGDAAFLEAQAEHRARVEKIDAVWRDMEKLAGAVSEQGAEYGIEGPPAKGAV